MSTAKPRLPRILLALEYARYAQEYLRSLPPEHFMEAVPQATQRKITVESFDLIHADCPEIQAFNELLIQYQLGNRRRPGQVVPDNMVVRYKDPIKATGSFDVPLQPVGPLVVLEYVSKNSERKDYEENFTKYERELKVPYYLLFYPDEQELTLYHLKRRKYVSVKPNEHGRYAIPELDLEAGIHDGWMRYWYKGKLLPLPADLQRDLDEARQQARQAQEMAEQERRRAEEERRRAEEERRRAEQEHQRAEEERRRAEQAAELAAGLERRIEAEQEARRALERELEQLRARLGQGRPQGE